MIRFMIRRLLWAIPTLLIVTFLVYVAIRIGTDPVAELRPRPTSAASQEQIQQYIEINGLYEGFGGYVRGYFKWLGGFVTGDWPTQHQGQPRGLAEPQGRDGQLAAPRRDRRHPRHRHRPARSASSPPCSPAALRDSTVNTTAFVGLSIPPFVSAIILQLVFAVYSRRWFPDQEPLPSRRPACTHRGSKGSTSSLMLKHLMLPVIVVAIQTIAIYSRYMRASLLDVLNSDYLRTARSKGISERTGARPPRLAQRADPRSSRWPRSTSERSSAG